MQIKFQGDYLVAVNNFLFNFKAKGRKSIARSKLLKLVEKKIKEFNEDEKMIIKEFAKLDEDGEPIILDGNRYDIDDLKGYAKAVKELNEEEVIIEGGEYVNNFSHLKEALEDYDLELEGADAVAYEILMDAFENIEKPKKEKE